MQDSWQSGNPYQYYMGRWSKLVSEKFIHWLEPKPGLIWLDVGCGTGALSDVILSTCNPDKVVAIDQSEGFVQSVQARFGGKVESKLGDAMSLPLAEQAVNITVSGLVLNFIAQPEKALSEMRRVTKEHGTVATYIWDYAGEMEFLSHFWDVATDLDPAALDLHEGRRFSDANDTMLRNAFGSVGFSDVEVIKIEIVTYFSDFEDYWNPFLGGQGPAPTYVAKLPDVEKEALRQALIQRLPFNQDGSITMSACAWSAKGTI